MIIALAILLVLSIAFNVLLWQRCVMYRNQRNTLRKTVMWLQVASIATVCFYSYKVRKLINGE